jgi:hypothetical protein
MFNKSQPILTRPDGTFVVTSLKGNPFHVVQNNPLFDEVIAFIAENPDAVQPEPLPPEPEPVEPKFCHFGFIEGLADIAAERFVEGLNSEVD